MLQVNRGLREIQPVDIISTFLGAHDFPADAAAGSYVDSLIDEMIPRWPRKGLAEFCDVYCDDGYYTVDRDAAHPGGRARRRAAAQDPRRRVRRHRRRGAGGGAAGGLGRSPELHQPRGDAGIWPTPASSAW